MIYNKDLETLQPGDAVWQIRSDGQVVRRLAQFGIANGFGVRACWYLAPGSFSPMIRLSHDVIVDGELCSADDFFLTEEEALNIALQRVQASLRNLEGVEKKLLHQMQVRAELSTPYKAGRKKKVRA